MHNFSGCLLVSGLTLTSPYKQVFSGNLLNLHIVLKIGNTQALVNGKPFIRETPPILISGRAMVPLRFIAETLSARVHWDGTEKKITVICLDKDIKLWVGKNFALINGKQLPLETPLF
ncbi:MAG: hypothetical protein DDT22_00751 [candidate division WS2 bacterium]|nr:hypothetical protein [Candidatus Lithacetigena glycinireducens]